ncbi:hypothetical protein FPSE_05686 [Fusarium pseudograminearum CS3096]|uniref:Uncharacterized protein n=1 Tax=Fusarium pseudograminearum (strain CS3096) TaxID=1028729 RepID=K3UP44_FUSPC|nr:hypothetical protein FPSE_05686 [Fusarium pseudograminearum CS3096]EKJ74101.1 hypothetical protein FPSE_05686 [Fusarium pseudograminearum CS3096]
MTKFSDTLDIEGPSEFMPKWDKQSVDPKDQPATVPCYDLEDRTRSALQSLQEGDLLQLLFYIISYKLLMLTIKVYKKESFKRYTKKLYLIKILIIIVKNFI